MTTVRICESAHRTMLEEVRSSPVETGGVLVGVPDPPTVVAAGSGGENAVREPTRFSSDVEVDRACLKHARELYGEQIVINGYYHLHPQGMRQFSRRDSDQAREFSRLFGDGKLLLVAIFSVIGLEEKPWLFLYGLCRPNEELMPVAYEIVKDDDERVHNAIVSAPVVPEVEDTDFWSDENFSFYKNSVGRNRLQGELDELRRKDWAVEVYRLRCDPELRVSIQTNGHKIEAVLPREYPLNPPRLFVKGAGELLQLEPLRQWNSGRSLIEVIQLAIGALDCPECRRRHFEENREYRP